MSLEGASGPREPVSRGLTGRPLGEWIVGDRIGAGGFADVYQARQPRLERDAVIKVLRVEQASATRVTLFEREARLASQLDHPYAAHVYSFGVEPDGLLWIAMELVRGKSLADMLRQGGPMPLERFVALFERLCEVVHTAHEAGLIHRDIKPANVMVVTRAGRLLPKLLDFGIAQLVGHVSENVIDGDVIEGDVAIGDDVAIDEDVETIVATNLEDGWTLDESMGEFATATATATSVDSKGPTVGTPAYMSPEQWLGTEGLDRRTDIYALGVLAHQCLTGRLPFRGTSARDYLVLHAKEPPPTLGPEFPAELASTLRRALAKDRQDRHQSALELGRAVRSSTTIAQPVTLSRSEATPWLLLAPSPLSDSFAAFEASRGRDASDALSQFLLALAQWIGVVSMAGSASRGPRLVSEVAALQRGRPGIREWLEVAAAVCHPFFDQPEDFPVPELVRWLGEHSSAREQLLALAGMCAEESEPTETSIGLLRSLLTSSRFLCDYGLDADSSRLALTDAEGTELFSLAPLVKKASPSPGADASLFVLAGSGRDGVIMSAPPRGFEIESSSAGPWLERFFCLENAGPVLLEEGQGAPYRGLAPFSSHDSALFFGRNRDVQALFNRILSQNFVALTGPSGSGKSSLVFAGLIPRLPEAWTTISIHPGNEPNRALASALASTPPGVGELESDISAIGEWLSAERRQLLIVINQAEELLTLSSLEAANQFASLIARLLEIPRVRVLLTIRDDFIGTAGQLEAWRGYLAGGLMLVSSPTREELYNMVVGPAQRVGFSFDDATLPMDMVEEVASQPAALPLLSFAASQLWSARDRENRALTRATYEDMGGVAGALAGYAEEVLAALPKGRQGRVRALFRRLVTKDGTRAVVRTSELATSTEERATIEHLVSARLLVAAEDEDGSDTISLIHEALLTRWPRLARWRLEDDAAVRFRDELRSASEAWREHERDRSYLWRGAALQNLDAFSPEEASFSPIEREFATESRAAQARSGRRRRVAVVVAIALLSATLVVLFVANRTAQQSRDRAENRLTDMLASRGFSELIAQRRLRALVYLQAAYQRGRDNDGIRIGLDLAQRGNAEVRASVAAHSGKITLATVAGLDDFLTSSTGDPVRLWRWTGERIELLSEIDHPGVAVFALSPDGKHLTTFGRTHLRFWSSSGDLLAEVTQTDQTTAIAYSPDGSTIVTGDGDQVALWSREGEKVATVGDKALKGNLNSFGFSDDGSLLASSRGDGVFQIWDLEARALRHSLPLGTEANTMFFSNDGVRVTLGTNDGRVVAVDTETGRIEAERNLFDDRHASVAPYPDRKRIVVTNAGDQARILDTNLEELGSLSANSDRMVGSVTTKGSLIFMMDGSQIRLFDPSNYQPLVTLDVPRRITMANVSADDKTVFVGTVDGQLTAYAATRRDALTSFREHAGKSGQGGMPNRAWDAQFTSDGGIASFDNDAIVFWRAESGEVERRIPLSGMVPRGMPHLRFSGDGRTLLAPDFGQAKLFDVETGLTISFVTDDFAALALAWGGPTYISTSTEAQYTQAPYLSVWEHATERLVAEMPTDEAVTDIEHSPVDETILYYCSENEVGRWDFLAGEVRWKWPVVRGYDVDVSSDGRLLVTSSGDGNIRIWWAETGVLHRQFRAPGEVIQAVRFAPGGKILATSSIDRSIYLWDVEAGVAIGRLIGHQTTIRTIDFSPDGQRMLSVGEDGVILVWDIAPERRSARELGELIANEIPFRLEGVEVVPTVVDAKISAAALEASPQ